jgi:hypothetical protein
MFFQYEGFRFESFKRIKSYELVSGRKYLLIIGTVRIKGTFLYHSEFHYLIHFYVDKIIAAFAVNGTWIFEFIEVKKKIVEAMEARALTMILKNLIDETFILN